MPGRLASYRLRRRLLKIASLAAIAGAAGLVSVLFWNTGRSYETPLSTEQALVPEQHENVRLSKAERKQALATAALFVRTAVVRERVAQSYALAHPTLRQGLSREAWSTGEIPVQYYPVDAARWRMDFQYEDELGLSVYVVPRAGADLRPMVFDMSMKPVAGAAGRHWLVSSWAPRFSSAGQTPASSSERLAVAAPAPGQRAALSTAWLLVPAFLIVGVLLVPAGLYVRERRRGNRAELEHAAALEERARVGRG